MDRQVGIGALPGARKSAAATPASEGAGLQRAKADQALAVGQFGERVARVGLDAYSRMQAEERDASDQTALMAASNALSDWKNQRLFDPDAGAFTKKGKDAMPLPEELHADFIKTTSAIAAGLSTPAQRDAFARLQSQEWQSIDLQVRRHVFTEVQGYRADELKALVGNKADSAIKNALDPKLVAADLETAVSAIRTSGPALGLGPEAIDAQVKAVQSKTHVGVIAQLLALEKDGEAKDYFEATKGQIAGEQLDQVTKALDEGTLRGQSQREADKIIAAGGTLTQQLEKAKDLEPKLRDLVEQRLEHESNVSDKAQRDNDEARQLRAYDVLDRTGDVLKIAPGDWAQFDGQARASMRAYAKARTKGETIETDLGTYYGLVQQAMDDPTGFAHVGLLSYRGKLDESDFKHLASVQLSIRSGDTKKLDKELGGTRTVAQIMADTIGEVDPKSDRAIQFRRALDKKVEEAQLRAGNTPLRNVEIQEMADDLWQSVVLRPGGWSNIIPGGAPFRDETKPIKDLEFKDIPVSDRADIRAELYRAGLPITKDAILEAYVKAKRKMGAVR